jgi:hypothetical protein
VLDASGVWVGRALRETVVFRLANQFK